MEKYTQEQLQILMNDLDLVFEIAKKSKNDKGKEESSEIQEKIEKIQDELLKEIAKKHVDLSSDILIDEFDIFLSKTIPRIDISILSAKEINRILNFEILHTTEIYKQIANLDKEKQRDILKIAKRKADIIGIVWSNIDKEIQKENSESLPEIIELVKEEPHLIEMIWRNTAEEIQKKYFELVPKIIEMLQEKHYLVESIWTSLHEEIQNENMGLLPKIIQLVKEEPYLITSIWKKTSKEVQEKNTKLFPQIIEYLKEDEYYLENIWIYTTEKVQKENEDLLPIIVKVIKKIDVIENILKKTNKEVQKDKITEILESVKENHYWLNIIWNATNAQVKLNSFFNVAEKLKSITNKENYEIFVKDYLGTHIEFSKNGSPQLPEDLKKIIFNVSSDKAAIEIDKNINNIIERWDEIKQYIQRKRANSIVNNGIEVRANNINEIIQAIHGINRPIPNSVSAQEFEKIRGSERVGVDVTYTFSKDTTVQRAYDLAQKMDSATSVKKYPDFSAQSEDGEICLNVLHPQDKSAILLGFDTHCCFRPNGNADNYAETQYSLLQYCLVTPYGGVLRCEDKEKSEVYMGTPFLVSGNCMMFHSYETANEKKVDEVNELLVEAARKAIEKSNDSINVVFMTDMSIGHNALHINGKIMIPSYFRPYTQGEYLKYGAMYNNLNYRNCVLAARVNNEILTGEDLLKWYKEKCHENPQELIDILNLHLGERKEEFDFGKRVVKENIEIPNIDLVQEFQKRKASLEEQREILALELQMKKLESIEDLKPWQEEELNIIKGKLEGKINLEMSSMSIEELKIELQKNRNKQFELYSGADIDLIAEFYGIDIEAELRKRIEKGVYGKKEKDKRKAEEGKAISVLIARIKESSAEQIKAISSLQRKIAQNEISDEELKILEQAGIDITEYRKVFGGEKKDISEENKVKQEEADVKQKVKRAMKDISQKEEIVAENLFENTTEEEIMEKSKTILRVSLIDEFKRKVAILKKGKEYEDLSEEERDEIDAKVQIVNINNIVNGIVEGNLTEQQQEALEELKEGKYQINIADHIAKIKDKDKIVRRLKLDKLAKLKASITLGLEAREKIMAIKGRIDGKRCSAENIAKIIYGNSWYIALDSKGYVQEAYINSEMDVNDYEKEIYEKTLEEQKKEEEKYGDYGEVDDKAVAEEI